MLRIIDSPNELLSMIVNFLNNPRKETLEKIKSLINESSASKLVPSFVFLGNWLGSNISTNSINYSSPKPIVRKRSSRSNLDTVLFNFSNNHSQNDTSSFVLNSMYKIIGLISLKVPPVLLLSGAFDLNWGLYQPHWLLHGFYAPINSRIIQLRSYVKPFSIYGQIVPFPPSLRYKTNSNSNSIFNINPNGNLNKNFRRSSDMNRQGNQSNAFRKSEVKSLPGLALELDNDPAYQYAILNHFKRLILNHAPLDFFKLLNEPRNSRTVLTNAIIDLLRDLNEERCATHEQLIFAFSSIFLYIHAFTLSNQIDGQLLCEFLQTRPFLSPFCILAMVNHIPVNLYLFSLLTPKEVLLNVDVDEKEKDKEIQTSQYVMVDLATNSSLNGFIEKMPLILSHYFLSTGPAGDKGSCNKKDDNDFLSFIHLSPSTLYNKMKAVLSVARERLLGSLHVSAMGILLLRCITFSLQRTLLDCAETKMFTPNFCSFVKTVFAILTTAFSDQLGIKFFEFIPNQTKLTDLTIRGALTHLFPLFLHHTTDEHVIQYCIHASNEKETKKNAHLMISKLLQCERVKLTSNVVDLLKECTDPLILLEYINAIPDTTLVETCQEYEDLMSIRSELMSKIKIKPLLQSRNVFIIESIDCGPSQPILFAIDNMSITNALKDASSLCKQNQDSLPSILSILTLTNFLQNHDFSHFLVNKLRSMLASDTYSEDGELRFEIRPCDYALPISQSLLGRLLLASHTDLAYQLLQTMAKPLINDTAPLHWILRFSLRFRSILTRNIIELFDQIVSQLPYADVLYKSERSIDNESQNADDNDIYNDGYGDGDGYSESGISNERKEIIKKSNHIFAIAQLLVERDMMLIQDPDVITREYQSPYRHAEAFSHCSLSFSSYSDSQLAEMLALPIFDLSRAWHKRDIACLCLAELATTMNSEVSYRYFSLLMENKNCEMALLAGRLFIMNARIDVFKMICQECQLMIHKDDVKLDYFMRMVMPSFSRLEGDESVATTLLCGFLESVTENSPRVLQESVIDAVGLVYLKMKLYKARTTLINAARCFSPELKGIIASSLEIMPDDSSLDAKTAQQLMSSAQKQKYSTGKGK